jgi:tRNA (guanine-N7-)-methyltransferase
MSKNKLRKFADMATYPHVFQYPFSALRDHAFDMRGRWNERFFKNQRPIVLELGCGKGEYTVGLAQRFPDHHFIGVDIKGARMWSGAKQAMEAQLRNVAFLRTHIELLPAFFAPGEVAELWITFPDPQMNKVNKRLTSARFLNLYRQLLGAPGRIHLKTDSPFLFAYTREVIRTNGLRLERETDDLYGGGCADEELLSIQTFYERQWLARGLTIKYLRFLCDAAGACVEPVGLRLEPDGYRSFGRRGGM